VAVQAVVAESCGTDIAAVAVAVGLEIQEVGP
jgi:hypothetical protein